MEIRIGGRFKISKLIGKGSFGEIYEGVDKYNNERVAVKLEHMDVEFPQVLYEAKIMRLLQGEEGIPMLLWAGQEGEYNVMVTNLLGPSLEDLMHYCNNKLSLKTVVLIGKQMFTRLEQFHAKQFLHRDIKPDNFLLGTQDKSDVVHIIDYGLAKKYIITKTGYHIPLKEGKGLTGTSRYTSIYTHKGMEQGRRDDVEGLLYVLIYLFHGHLPWMKIKGNREEKAKKIGEMKMKMPLPELIGQLPMEFAHLLHYARALRFEERPDYSYCKKMLDAIFFRAGYSDIEYDWKKLSQPVFLKELQKMELTFLQEEYRTRRREDRNNKEKGQIADHANKEEESNALLSIVESKQDNDDEKLSDAEEGESEINEGVPDDKYYDKKGNKEMQVSNLPPISKPPKDIQSNTFRATSKAPDIKGAKNTDRGPDPLMLFGGEKPKRSILMPKKTEYQPKKESSITPAQALAAGGLAAGGVGAGVGAAAIAKQQTKKEPLKPQTAKSTIQEVTEDDDEEEEAESEEEEEKTVLPPVKPSKEKEVKPMNKSKVNLAKEDPKSEKKVQIPKTQPKKKKKSYVSGHSETRVEKTIRNQGKDKLQRNVKNITAQFEASESNTEAQSDGEEEEEEETEANQQDQRLTQYQKSKK